jgi:hypothetical protein
MTWGEFSGEDQSTSNWLLGAGAAASATGIGGGAGLLMMVAVGLYLAKKAILKDEALVRSTERLR